MTPKKIENLEFPTHFLRCQLQPVGKLPPLWSFSVQLTANAESSVCQPQYPVAQTQHEFSAKKV